jgi:hypothetical protein
MICLRCAHLDLRSHPQHAAIGLGQCKRQPLPGVFEVIARDRDCAMFQAADDQTVETRLKWWEGRVHG